MLTALLATSRNDLVIAILAARIDILHDTEPGSGLAIPVQVIGEIRTREIDNYICDSAAAISTPAGSADDDADGAVRPEFSDIARR